MRTPSGIVFGVALLALAGVASGQERAGTEGYEVVPVRGNVYMLASAQGNITVQVGKDPGHDGVLLVDTGPAELAESAEAAIRKISNEPIRFVLNTSADEDHIGGTALLVEHEDTANRQAAVGVFAQDNVFLRLNAAEGIPFDALPTLTFERTKSFPFNGETVEMMAEPAAVTDGDSIVFFRGSNVISAGDVFLTTGYPVIDVDRGGSIQGELAALNHILELAVPHQMQEGGTMVIPGHGRLCDEADVTEYRDMMTIIHDRVADRIEKGDSLDQVQAAKLTRDYDGRYNTDAWTGEMLVEAIYRSLMAADGGSGK